ncbi:hypothetical protein GGH99_007480, partial [Coemansia sp. RSA 1285]
MAIDGEGTEPSFVGVNIPTPEKVTAVALGIAEATISSNPDMADSTPQDIVPTQPEKEAYAEPMDVLPENSSDQLVQSPP